MVKAFISWASIDPRMERIAALLEETLSAIFEDRVDIFFSPLIRPGERGYDEIIAALKEAEFGFALISQRTSESPWVLYEFGHLHATLGHHKVFPLLLDLSPGDLPGPVREFQATSLLDVGGMKRIVEFVADLLGYDESDRMAAINRSRGPSGVVRREIENVLEQVVVRPDRYEGGIRYNSDITRAPNFQMPKLFERFEKELLLVGINLNFLLNLRRSTDVFIALVDALMAKPERRVRILIADLWDQHVRYTYDKVVFGNAGYELPGLDETFVQPDSEVYIDRVIGSHLGERASELKGRLEIRAIPLLMDTFWFVDVDMARPTGSLMLLPMTAGIGVERPALYFDASEHHPVFAMYYRTMRHGLDIAPKRRRSPALTRPDRHSGFPNGMIADS